MITKKKQSKVQPQKSRGSKPGNSKLAKPSNESEGISKVSNARDEKKPNPLDKLDIFFAKHRDCMKIEVQLFSELKEVKLPVKVRKMVARSEEAFTARLVALNDFADAAGMPPVYLSLGIVPSVAGVYDRWKTEYEAAAKADKGGEASRQIKRLHLECTSATLVAGTEFLVAAILAYCNIDGRDCKPFIEQQSYRPADSVASFYCVTFDLFNGHFGRVLTDRSISHVDFADLFGHPWNEYKTAGFHHVYISRLDRRPIDEVELETLYERVTKDLYSDYAEDDLAVCVDLTEQADTAKATVAEH